MSDDVSRIQEQLIRVERDAKKLPWAAERPWTRQTHVWWENDMPIVDLHDLGVSLGRKSVRQVGRIAGKLESGAVCFVTGVGKNSMGPSKMRAATQSVLGDMTDKKDGWWFRPLGPGRFVLITDEDKAPRAAKGELGPLFWGGVIFFLVLLVTMFVLNVLGL